MVVITILLLLAAALTYPYISTVILRYTMLRRLRAEAKTLGFRVRRRSRWILFSQNRSPRCDLIISNSERIYAIKLWSSYYKGRALIADEANGLVWERKIIKAPLYVDAKNMSRRHDGKAEPIPEMSLPARLAKDPRLVRVLLIYPSYREVRRVVGGKEYRAVSKDTLLGRVICSPSAFFSMMRAQSNKDISQNEDKEIQSEEKIVNSNN